MEEMMAPGSTQPLANPLTRLTRTGEPYVRPPEVQAELDELLGANAVEQLARAKVADKTSTAYVRDECLVYLIQQAALGDDAERYNTLAALLLKRIVRGIQRKLRVLGVADDDVADLEKEVVLVMITAILEGPPGEYFQVRFRSALYRRIVKVYDAYARQRRRTKHDQSLDATASNSSQGEGDDDSSLGALIEGPDDVAAEVERRLLVPEALAAITDPRHRKAFVLYHYHGWQIESSDSAEPTLSRLFARTPRMVRNWLGTADRQLAEWRAKNV
jgi:DNA-directed RNA polymerase specialized sigma24 family protein